MLVQKCSYPKCGLRIAVTKVFWRSMGDKSLPYCCVQCWFQHRKEVENETQVANQDAAVQTSSEVPSNGFSKHYDEVAQTPPTRKVRPSQTTFEDLNLFW